MGTVKSRLARARLKLAAALPGPAEGRPVKALMARPVQGERGPGAAPGRKG
jgi:hypothetical protein